VVAAESLYFDKWLVFDGVVAGPSTFSAGVAVAGCYTDPFVVIAVFAFWPWCLFCSFGAARAL